MMPNDALALADLKWSEVDVRLANLENDFWTLRCAEELNRANPEKFQIPTPEERQALERGQAARLIFDIEAADENDTIVLCTERMWVIVSERVGNQYIGILDNAPESFEPGESAYLCAGAEIAFGPEHVIDIEDPPQDYVEELLKEKPKRVWPRE